MSKYRSSTTKAVKEKSKQPHFLWRGIGCFIMILIPVISVAIGYELVQFAIVQRYPIPHELLGLPRFPALFYKSSGIMIILRPIASIKHLYAYASAALLVMITLGGITSLGYAFVYRMVGPSRYGPLDVPPPKIKAKPYKR